MSRVAPQTAAQTWSARVSPLSAKAADKGALAARSHDSASLQFLKLAHSLLTKLRQFRPIFASFEPVRLLISMGVKPRSPHNPKVGGSNPPPATKSTHALSSGSRRLLRPSGRLVGSF